MFFLCSRSHNGSPFIQGQSQSPSKGLQGDLHPTSLTSLTTYFSSSCSLGSSHTDLLDVSLAHQACVHLRALPLEAPLLGTLFPKISSKATLSPPSSLCRNVVSWSSILITPFLPPSPDLSVPLSLLYLWFISWHTSPLLYSVMCNFNMCNICLSAPDRM